MPPAFHSKEEEDAFMKDLLSGLDSSIFDAPPSPDMPRRATKPSSTARSPLKRSPHKLVFKTPTKQRPGKASVSPLNARVNSNAPALSVKSANVEQKENATAGGEQIDIAQLCDGAEGWDWDDMNSDFMTPKKSPTKRHDTLPAPATRLPALEVETREAYDNTAPYRPETCTRCTVKDVKELVVDGETCKELLVTVDTGKEERHVVLRDDWFYTDVRKGDIINVIGTFDLAPSSSSALRYTIDIDAKKNLLVHHPDILITATALSNASACRRRPLLQTLVRSSTEITPALVWGNILHEVMQICLREERWDDRFLDAKVGEIVRANLGSLLKIEVTVEQAIREVKMHAGGLKNFAEKYIAKKPKGSAVLTNTRASNKQTSLLAITDLLDVEEDIWSPTYGLKGKLDASVAGLVEEVQPSAKDNPFVIAKGQGRANKTITKHKFPFEIKTGRAVAGLEHRAQTMLYTLLMGERYEEDVQSGLLYYTQSEEIIRVPAARNELRGLMTARNEMAEYMIRRMGSDRGPRRAVHADAQGELEVEVEDCTPAARERSKEPFLPPTLDDVRTCGRCYVVDTCMLYRRAVEGVVDDTSPIRDIYDLKTGHLTSNQADFFRVWESLISMEEQEVVRFRKELWTLGAEEREKKGRCFSKMVVDTKWRPDESTAAKQEGKIHRYTFRFVRHSGGIGQESLLSGHMSPGDAVTVSVEPDLLALARGFILELTPDAVIVGVDHDLSAENVRVRRAKPQAKRDGSDAVDDILVYRIDKDELFGGMARIRDNLAQLFYPEGDSRCLERIVDLKPPVFDEIEEPIVPEHEPVAEVIHRLNGNQQEAIRKVLSARDYALILGMPGTGKTTVVAAIIKALVCMGKTVLLTSHTHSAVDTILLKLKDDADFGILRLGNLDKIHPKIHSLTLSARRTATTVEQLEQQVMTPPVVATTCLSIDHPLFLRRHFDYCIVDEASQITLPTCLGPLRHADKFVLVGDHFQLPPLVRNRDARKGGLDVSLFRRLSEAHPHAVVDLNEQYRMNEDIMLLSNKLIYSDRLRCGTQEVAKRGLVLPNPEFLPSLHAKSSCSTRPCWIEHLLDERCKAVFVDTDAIPAEESRVGDLVQNVTEANLVHQLTQCLLQSGVQEDQIGVISLYRQQIKLLSYLLQDHQGIEVLTADRSQGRDKDCVIISMVRSNESGSIGDLLKDWRRINVSFTRARSKLVIFGSRKTLKTTPLLEEFFQLMEGRNWILALPHDAATVHKNLGVHNARKRTAEDGADSGSPDCVSADAARGQKKARTVNTAEGLTKNRHILKDLLNGSP